MAGGVMVKRYSMQEDLGYPLFSSMCETKNGDYVKFSDYFKLQKERDEFRDAAVTLFNEGLLHSDMCKKLTELGE
jgi:hypothetical protein